MSLLTDEQEQRGSSFNFYGSQIFPSQIINESKNKVQGLFHPNLLLLLPMPLQLLNGIRNRMKH